MATPKAMESLLGDTLKEVLTDYCINNVDSDDTTKANYVVMGKPTSELRSAIVVSVHMQHPLGPDKDVDKLVEGAPRSAEERPLTFPRESIGGATFEMITGAVQVRIKEGKNHQAALNTKSVTVDRIKKAIKTDSRLRVLKDDLGNTMTWIEVFRHSGHAAGGGEVSIFIEWVDFRAIVVSSNSRN